VPIGGGVDAPARNRTLVIDDDPAVRRVMQRSLELANFDVVVAAGGEEGLAILERDPAIGLILLDLAMPGLNGWGFLKVQRAHPRLSRIPTVVVSGSTLEDDEDILATVVLRKPVARDHLISVVGSYCQPKQPA
jgi:CheY-like chemotaxis protein